MNILFLCLPSKKDTKGLNTIFCRVTIAGERCQFSTNLSILAKNWEQKKQKVKNQDENAHFLNITLSEMKNKLLRLFVDNDFQCIDDFKKAYFVEKNEKKTLNEIITSFLEKKKQLIGIDKSLGGITPTTFKSTNTICNHLSSFAQENHYPSDLNNVFLNKYHQYLIEELKISNDYRIKCLQMVKTIINYSIELNEIQHNSLAFAQLPKRSNSNLIFLTNTEKERLENHHFIAQKLQQVQDLFLFQCYTGLAYVDMYNLSEKHIFKNNDRLFIKIERQKTKQESIIPFLPQAQEIWNKHEGKLPKLSNQKYNFCLKQIAGMVGIEKNLITHDGRKTFACLSLNAGISIEVVSKCLGHSDIRITQKMYAKVNETRILREFENISF